MEVLRRKIERNRRLFEEHEKRTPERDRALAELLAKKFMRQGQL
jgi:hypothetical protein